MKYYQFAYDSTVMGFVPQDDEIIGRYNVNAPNSIWNFAFSDNKEGLWVPEGIKMRHRAKFTDRLSFINIGWPYLVLSEHFLKVISLLHLPEHQIFPLSVIKQKKTVQYYIFISKQYFPEYFDFEHSEFYIKNDHTKATQAIQITNVESFLHVYKNTAQPNYLRASKIELKTTAIKHDIFRLARTFGGPNYIVSEIFKEAIVQAGLTGVLFKPFDGSRP